MTPRGEELAATTILGVVLLFVGSAALGWLVAGPLGAFAAAMVGGFASVMGVSWGRLRRARRMLDDPALPDLTPLPPHQALAVMSAAAGGVAGAGMASFRSALLARLEEIRDLARKDPSTALELARELSDDHPHNPAARAQVARCSFAVGESRAGIAAGAQAIALAIDGGMNPTAAALFDELAVHREALVLARRHLEQLARILEHRGDQAGAAWCRARLPSSTEDPNVDPL